MNQEALRQHNHYASVRERLWPRETASNDKAVDRIEVGIRMIAPPITVNVPEIRRRVLVHPWPKPLWMDRPIHFNQHVVAWLRHKLALERPDDAASEERRTMAEIMRDIMRGFPSITIGDIKGRSRCRVVVQARQTVMYYIYREREDISLPEIGRSFGGRDHTTVLHAVRKMEAIYGKARNPA